MDVSGQTISRILEGPAFEGEFLLLSSCILFNFANYVFLLLCLCVLIFMYCPVFSVSLCCSVYCLCVNVYCTTATGCHPNCSQEYILSYRIISYNISYHISYHIVSYRISYIVSYHIVSYLLISYRIVSFDIISYRIIYHIVDCLTFENGTVGLSRNVGNKLPIYAA